MTPQAIGTARAVHPAVANDRTDGGSQPQSAVEAAPNARPARADTLLERNGIDLELFGDSDLLLRRLQSELRDAGAALRENDITASSQKAQAASERRTQALEQAMKAMDQANGFLGLPSPVGEIVTGIAIAVAVAAAFVTTGPVGVALVVAGAALLLLSQQISEAGVELGLWNDDDAKWVAIGCQLVGTVLMAIGGGAFSGGAAPGVAEAIATGSKIVQGAVAIYHGAQTTGQTIYRYEADGHQVTAQEQRVVEEEATDAMEDGTTDLRRLVETFARIMRRLSEAERTSADVRLQTIQTMA